MGKKEIDWEEKVEEGWNRRNGGEGRLGISEGNINKYTEVPTRIE